MGDVVDSSSVWLVIYLAKVLMMWILVRMRREAPRLSFRPDPGMAGAIFMSSSETREQCFRSGVFGLPSEYQDFVENVKPGMPLFLFDYTERKLYGVFAATSHGGLNVNRAAFRSTLRPYPAQVCFEIIWKCRPLAEDDFSHAIKENYYLPYKFYFDLSFQQVVRLYELFNNKRVEQPIRSFTTSSSLEKEHFSKGRPDKRSLSPNISPNFTDQSHTLIPSSASQISTFRTNYSAPTSMQGIVPHSFEAQTNVSMSSVTKQIGPIHSSHDVPKIPPYHNNAQLRGTSTVDGISNQVYAPCSLSNGYHRDRFVTDQSYPISQVPTGGDKNYVNSTQFVPPYHFSLANQQDNPNWKDNYDMNCNQCKEMYTSEHQHLSKGRALTAPLSGQQGIPAYPEVPEVLAFGRRKDSFSAYIPIADCAEDFENDQGKHGFNRSASGSSDLGNVIGANLSDQLHANREIGAESNTTIVPGQRSHNSVFNRLSQKQQPLQQITGPSLSQMLHSLSQRTKQWDSENRVHISQKSEIRSDNHDRTLTYDAGKQLVGEQSMDITCPVPELNPPSLVEGKEITEPPFFNFKRRSETAKLGTNLGKEINGKMKRRKLVRPSFGEGNNATTSGKELQVNGTEDRRHPHLVADGKMLTIDLNEPASADNGLVKEDGSIVLCPLVIKMQTEKSCEVNTTHKSNYLEATEVISKQDQSVDSGAQIGKVSPDLNVSDLKVSKQDQSVDNGAQVGKVSLDLNVADLKMSQQDQSVENGAQTGKVSLDLDVADSRISKPDQAVDNGAQTGNFSFDLNVEDLKTIDESKLQEIFDSPVFQELEKLRNVKFNKSQVARSSMCCNDNIMKMEMNSDGST